MKFYTVRIMADNRIKRAEPVYTGGGIYVMYVALSDGNYALADASYPSVRIIDADPTAEENADDCWYEEWQEAHLVEDLGEDDATEFVKEAILWVKEHKPSGNYCMGDMDYLLEDLNEEM